MKSRLLASSYAEEQPLTKPIPVSAQIALVFGLFWLSGLAFGLPAILPSNHNVVALNLHFFGPVAIGAFIQFLIILIYSIFKSKRAKNLDHSFTTVRLFPLLVLSVFLYFNFKAWTPLVRPQLYDDILYQTDLWMTPLIDTMLTIRRWLATLGWHIDLWYSLLFYLMFFLSFAVHAVVDPAPMQRRFVIGLCLNLLLGGLAYWIMPSLGPFIYRSGENAGLSSVQAAMLSSYTSFRETGIAPASYFTASLGAMPSLHVGHSMYLLFWAAWRARPLLVVYIPITLFIMIEAVATGFHYVLDIPAGLLLAVCSFMLSGCLLRREQLKRAA